ncbi:ankyrin repeat domain-containing protein [Pectobacterium polaris]|uniref:ankyrin repeat domain-containing protein n=1 Tax=Pectobacterium polaris TaxID=2042057 RepID=UPI000EA25E35|nr:ankyrin repeat domain-containing protein [Pectobacterium polaris]RJL19175.1 ankyrin repeat domain-containing protein [Pectobacterium polaris]
MMWGILSRRQQSLHDICCSELPLEKKKRQIDRFLAQGGNINERQPQSANILGSLMLNAELPDIELVRYLLDKGAFIELPGGFSSLQLAIEFFHLELAGLYLQHGADVHYLNFFSNSWLNYLYCPQDRHTYTDDQRKQMLDLLLRYGLDLNRETIFWTSLETSFPIEIVMCEKDVSLLEHIFQLDVPIHFAETGIFERLFNYKSEWLPLPLFQQIVKRAGGSAYREPGVILSEDKKIRTDGSLLEMAIFYAADERLCECLLDTYPDIRCDLSHYSFVLDAMLNLYSPALVERIIQKTADIDRPYSLFIPPGNKTKPGWEVDAYPDVGSTAMMQFVYHRCVRALRKPEYYRYFYDCVALLLKYGASPNVDKMTGGLHYEMRNWSILHSVCIDMVSENHFCPELLDLLVAHGANANLKKGIVGEPLGITLLQRGFNSTNEGVLLQVMNYLYEHGMDLQATNVYMTNFAAAAGIGSRPLVMQWLIDHGVDIHTLSGWDNSPVLHKTISLYSDEALTPERRAETVAVLLDNGAYIDEFSIDEQFTPLMCAANYGKVPCVEILLARGANPHARSANGMTPLHCALHRADAAAARIVTLLHQYGVTITRVDEEGNDLLVRCIRNKHEAVFKALLEILSPSLDDMHRLLDWLAQGNRYCYFSDQLRQQIARLSAGESSSSHHSLPL